MKHYKNTEQITELSDYEFKLPKFGKSTTDPSYYEPSATRIANMRKSAQSAKSLYDFDGSDLPKIKNKRTGQLEPDWSKQNLNEIHITPGRKQGLTREEISQNLNDIKSDFNNYQEDKKAESEQLKKDIENSKTILKSLNEDGSSDTEAAKQRSE